MLRIKGCLIFIVAIVSICSLNAFAQSGAEQEKIKRNGLIERDSSSTAKDPSRPVLAITPREIDLGSIGRGETGIGEFTFKNMGTGNLDWSTNCPEGWETIENKKLTSKVEDDADYLSVEVGFQSDTQWFNVDKSKAAKNRITMKLEAGGRKLICQKNLPVGTHKQPIRITSVGGSRTIYVTFKIFSFQEAPLINLNPIRMDMGSVSPGKIISKKIKVTNNGKEMLTWSVAVQKPKRGDSQSSFKKERYASFNNEDAKDTGTYIVPAHLRDSMEMIGKWQELDGYPFSTGSGNSIKFRFNGTGISILLQTHTEEGNLAIYVDDSLINLHDWYGFKKEKKEVLVADGLADGHHVLTVTNKEGRVELEGVKISGRDVARGQSGWIVIFPNSGTTTSETDYVNIKLNTAYLLPGYYSDNIVFNSNGGEEIAEVFVEVVSDSAPKYIDVFLYSRNFDYLFTANPQAELKRFSQNNYIKEGIAFRLFASDTPGTTNFYRWYNPQKKDHFYHHDRKGGGKNIQGYVFEGSIGNIATSRMTNTRELFRWYNSSTSRHYYSTDPKGGGGVKKGYAYDGIAGYVK